ncbi:Alpha/Beta hydrolase protein [Leptodontidium sp. 2 PMI_412]|nr:Alpha/Beta hydrolase protein [Leptodontidium sp. 2 PMI_412]
MLHYLRLKLLATLIRLPLALKSLTSTSGPKPDETIQIPSRDSGRGIKAHVYKAALDKYPKPVLINFHGSGFVFPLHGDDDEFCRYISENTSYTVVDVAYRLAPEHPFPCALEDVEDAIKWVISQPAHYDLSHISISGFSAGANLALVASASSFPRGTVKSVIAYYPPVDIAQDPYLKVAPDPTGNPIPASIAHIFNECYIPRGVDPRDPRISPAFLPPDQFPASMFIITCGRDSLAPEAEELAERLAKVPGIEVVQKRMESCDHAWNLNTKEGTPQDDAKKEAYAMTVEFLRNLKL